jgi:hypothetical protein
LQSFIPSPLISIPYLFSLTVETGRILGRELFPQSPISPHSVKLGSGDRSPVLGSPSSVTLTDMSGKAPLVPRSKTPSRRSTDAGPSAPSGTDSLPSDTKLPSTSPRNGPPRPRVVIRQPSSISQPLHPPTTSSASESPCAPGGVQREDLSLLPAFLERTPHSAASSSSSLSFASSVSSKLHTAEAEVRQRDVRRLKHAKKASKSRSPSPSKDVNRDVQDPLSKPSSSRREFSPTRSLKKAISIQNIPKKSQGSSVPSSLSAAEDTKLLKKQRSFHHSCIPVPPLPPSLKQAGSSNFSSARDASLVPEEHRVSVQASPKSPLSSPVLNPILVRKRLFSGTSLRRPTSPQSPELDDDMQSILSLSPATSPVARPHTAIPLNRPSDSNNSDLPSFWDEEFPTCPSTTNRSRDYAPRHILSAADILKFENMVRDGENLNKFQRSRGNSFTSLTTCKQSVRTASSSAAPVRSFSPPSAIRRTEESFGETSGKSPASNRPRTRGNSLQGKAGNVTNGRPHTAIPSSGQSTRSLSFQSLHALHGLPLPPPICPRPSTYSLTNSSTAGDRSSVVIMPLSPPPVRRSAARRVLDPVSPTPVLRPGISRRPSFLDMKDDADQEPPPPPPPPPLEDSFLDMGKASLDTVRSGVEEDPVPSRQQDLT